MTGTTTSSVDGTLFCPADGSAAIVLSYIDETDQGEYACISADGRRFTLTDREEEAELIVRN